MASQITATLPTLNFPREVDYPTQEDWAAFSAAAELNFGILGGDWSTQMQLWKTEANAMSTELNTNATIAQGLADYQGDWTSQGYTLGQSVSVSGIYYICKLTHATGQNPTDVGSIYWNLAIGNWNLKADKTEVALKIDKDISPYTSKPTPIDADLIPLSDSASSFGIKKLSWANIKATLKTYFDTLYTVASSETTSGIIELATTAEAQAGTDDLRAITPLKLRNALNASGTAPIYACRAWVNFNGTGTVAIRASGNVSSITDNGVGSYTVNFTTAMPDTYYSKNVSANLNYAVRPTFISVDAAAGGSAESAPTTTSFSIYLQGSDTYAFDAKHINVSVFR